MKTLALAIAIALLAVVFARVPLASVGDAMRQTRLSWAGAALAALLIAQVVDAVRLRRWTDLHGLGWSTWDLLEIILATKFYSLALPGGSLSGIAVRCSQLSPRQTSLATGISLLADNAVATAGMSAVGMVFLLGERPEGGLLIGTTMLAVLTGLMLLLTASLSCGRISDIQPLRCLMTRLVARVQAVHGLRDAGRLDKGTLLHIGTLAIASNLLSVMVYYLLAEAASLNVSLVTIGWVRSAMIIAATLPVSVSGLGLREGASLLLLSRYGIAAEHIIAFSLTVFAVSVLLGLLGGVLEMRRLSSASRP